MPAQTLFDIRREVAEIERRWGGYATFTYNAVGVAPSSLLAPPAAGGNVLQAGFEAYWRPPVIGYRNGRIFEVFARTFQTLADESGGPDRHVDPTGHGRRALEAFLERQSDR